MKQILAVVAFVGVWMTLGIVLRLDGNQYLLLGLPLTLLFQRLVARKPIRAMWVREAPPARWSLAAIATTAALGAVAVWMGIDSMRARKWTLVGYSMVQAMGAVAAGYAIAPLDRERLRRGAVATLIAIAIGVSLDVGRYVLGHGHFAPRVFVISLLQYQAVTFLVEEVTFRGALDAYVAERFPRWWSALVPAFLWGLWHLPILPLPPGSAPRLVLYAGAAVVLVVVHLPIGLALAMAWRRSGNLWLPSFAHSFLDAIRNAIKT
jgi:membrane protease YdiL (CAAX protease family)